MPAAWNELLFGSNESSGHVVVYMLGRPSKSSYFVSTPVPAVLRTRMMCRPGVVTTRSPIASLTAVLMLSIGVSLIGSSLACHTAMSRSEPGP